MANIRNRLCEQFQILDQHQKKELAGYFQLICRLHNQLFRQLIQIHRQHCKPIAHTDPNNRWSSKEIVRTIPFQIFLENRRNQLYGHFRNKKMVAKAELL